MTPRIPVSQFIYSNVEAEYSPTGRRGFQVWRWSARLAAHQREIARRLEDFDWPAADAAMDVLTVRRAFFTIPTGDVVVVRTVPVRERDAMNRSGRFHAHAVVLTPDVFARVGNNPFALFDHFQFRNGPTEPVDGDRGGGVVEDALEVSVGPPNDAPRDAAAAALFPLLLRWLDVEDAKPAALPLHPERVAGVLRELFRRLPPDLRRRATFDTLSSGQQLGALPFRFAGAFDPPTLRDWAFRKVYRVEERAGGYATTIEPPANAALDALATAWEAGAADDAARGESFRLLKALADPAPLPDVSAGAVALVAAVPDARERFRARVARRLEQDLEVAELRELVRTDAENYVGALSADSLRRLAEPLPAAMLAKWVFDGVTRRPLPEAAAGRLERWAASRVNDRAAPAADRDLYARLYLIGLRWQPGGWERLDPLREKLSWVNPLVWMRKWERDGARPHPALAGLVTARGWADRLVFDFPQVTNPEADQLGWQLALADPADAPPGAAELNFALAFRRRDEQLGEYLRDARRPAQEWLYDLVQSARFRFAPVTRGEGAGVQVGVAVRPPPDLSGGDFLLQALASDPRLRSVLLNTGARRILEAVSGGDADGRFDAREAEAALELDGWPKLDEHLRRLSTTAFRAFVQRTVRRHFGSLRVEMVHADGGAVWVAGRPVPRTGDPDKPALWEKIVAAGREPPTRLAAVAFAMVEALPAPVR